MALAFVQDGVITQYPIGLIELRRRFPNTSFPRQLETADLTSFGVVSIADTEQPSINFQTQRLEEGTPAVVDGTWQQVWNVIELTADELQAIADGNAASVRAVRNQKLAACDWTVLTDSPLTTAKKTQWKAYRTELRDITAAEGFPNSISWPTEPS
jgi:hypothetical protein|tara:strand:- start:182 stop:649 length:468 start_codon:yes stop_codon:yes gene_type:complete